MGLCSSKELKKVLGSKIVDVIEAHVGQVTLEPKNDDVNLLALKEAKEAIANSDKLLQRNIEALKEAKDAIASSDKLIGELKAFILQMKHIESL
jgi:hypothetical protein